MASSPRSSRLERLPRKSHASSPYAPGQSDSASLLSTGANALALSTSSSGIEHRQTQAPSRLPTLVGLDHSRGTLPSNPAPNTSHGQPDSLPSSTSPNAHVVSAASSSTHDARSCRPWTAKEDLLLIASVKKYGRQWAKIKVKFDQAPAGTSPRTEGSIYGRYTLLEAEVARQQARSRSLSLPLSSSSSQTPSKEISTALASASSALHSRKRHHRHGFEPWTPQEIRKLASIGKSTRCPDAHRAFCSAFPGTTRTKEAILAKWFRVIKKRGAADGRKGDRYAGDQEGEDEDEEQEQGAEAREEESMTPKLGGPSGAALSRAFGAQSARGGHYPQAPLLATAAGRGMPVKDAGRPDAIYSSNINRSAGNSISQRANTTWQSDHRELPHDAEQQSRFPSSFTKASQRHTSQPPTLDCTINRTSTGFTIYNAPPNHRVYVPTPFECQVVGPLPPSIMLDDDWSPFEGAAAAPFTFKADAKGDIKAINAPRGTTTSMSVVRSEEGEVVGTQTVFTASGDGYTVAFERSVG